MLSSMPSTPQLSGVIMLKLFLNLPDDLATLHNFLVAKRDERFNRWQDSYFSERY